MTEDQIERAAERAFDRLDRRLMNSEIGQEQYDCEAKQITAQADERYRQRRGRIADRVDGYDRDDLGESPDY